MEQVKPGFKFKPQLSGLRFCAVLFVIVYHYSDFLLNLRFKDYDLGSFIVFFFVLSSYLITRILLDAKQKAATEGMAGYKIGVAFLIRRTLRIFPAYYAYLFILSLFPVEGLDTRQHPVYYYGYLYNFWVYITGNAGYYTFHLWTLAVEEQFYLLWPWVILFIPNRHLLKVFLMMVIGAVAFRVIFLTVAFQPDLFPVLILTPGCLDAFGAGAILAYFHYSGKENNRWIKWVCLVVLPVWGYLIATQALHQRTFYAADRLFVSLFSVLAIDTANRGYTGITKKLLECKPVQYLSKISYGMYLYHMIASLFFWKLFEAVQHRAVKNGYDFTAVSKLFNSHYVSFWFYFGIAVLCATLSWYVLEKPFNNLKKLFNYVVYKMKRASPPAQ